MVNAQNNHFFTKSDQGQSIYSKIYAYRDKGTYADEWLRLFVYVLLPLSAVFTLGFGFALHYNMTLSFLGHYGAIAFGTIFTVFIEAAKIIASWWVLRLLFFGLFKHGWSSLGLMFCGAAIAVGGFMWSYYNSTQGVQYLTTYISATAVARPTVDLAASTADVDARVTQSQKTAQKGLGIKWQGKTTGSGAKIAEHSAAAIAQQEKQKTLLLESGTKEQARMDDHRDGFINTVAGLMSKLGGKMEWFQLFILFGIVCCENALWNRMNKGGTPTPPGGNAFKKSSQPNQSTDYQANAQEFQNRTRAGFSVGDRRADPTTTSTTVPQTVTTVPQQKPAVYSSSPDDVLKLHHMQLQKEPSNFNNPQALRQTVLDRVVKKLVNATEALKGVKRGDVSAEACQKFRKMLYQQLFPHLQDEEYARHAFQQLDDKLIVLYDATEGEGAI